MPKKKTRAHSQDTKRFQAFLAEASKLAPEVIIAGSLARNWSEEFDTPFEEATELLVQRFCSGYPTTDEDDCCTFQQAAAYQEAAYMLGIAIGMRLKNAELGAAKGGAR